MLAVSDEVDHALYAAGHVHPDETSAWIRRLGPTVVRNVAGRHLLDMEPGAGARLSPADLRHAR